MDAIMWRLASRWPPARCRMKSSRAVDSDFDAEANVADVTETLNGLDSTAFTPALTLLDDLFHSLAVTPPDSAAVATTQLITATQIITFTPPCRRRLPRRARVGQFPLDAACRCLALYGG
ncbi:MAG: hypothetical protein R2867_10920 [Caldilineaceae bacterium]